MSRTTAFITLLNTLRQEDIDTFADIYYLLADDIGISFDMAGCFLDFVDTDRMAARIAECVDAGLRVDFLVDSLLARLESYVVDMPARALTAVCNNTRDLDQNPGNKPDVLLKMAQTTNARLLSQEQEDKRRRFYDLFMQEKYRLFTQDNIRAWEQDNA